MFAALGFGLFTILMGFLAKYFGDLILQMALSIFGFVGGPLSALLSLGLFLPFVNSWVSGDVCVERNISLLANETSVAALVKRMKRYN